MSYRASPSKSIASGSSQQLNTSQQGSEILNLSSFEHGSFFETFFTYLSQFYFEKAKEISDKEKEYFVKNVNSHSCSSVPSDPSWGDWTALATIICQILSIEKAYMNITYMVPKGFLRKDCNIKATLQTIKRDLKKLFDKANIQRLAKETCLYVNTRNDMIVFYEKCALLGSAKNVEISDLLAEIELLIEKFQDEKRELEEPISLNAIYNSISWEMDSLGFLLKAHNTMQDCDFLPALIALQECDRKLSDWSNHVQNVDGSKKGNYLKTPVLPSLYQWICKLKGCLLSKFSFIFYEVLAKNSNQICDIKTVSTKLQSDYYFKIVTFHKKSDASFICLLFDARGTNYYPNGYQHPARVVTSPQGMDSFPAILAYPTKPANHWPNVVMILNERFQKNPSTTFVGFFDNRVQSTYFIQKSDAKLFILAIFESKRSEKDSYIQKFMSELASDLKCGKIFASLKTGVK